MTVVPVLAVVVPSLATYLALTRRWGRWYEPPDRTLAAVLAPGLAVGLASSLYFLLLLRLDPRAAVRLDAAFWLVVCGWLLVDARRHATRPESSPGLRPTPGVVLAAAAFLAMLGTAAVSLWVRWLAGPHGSWDTIGIWTLRARAVARGAPDWPAIVSPALEWSHPDYPLLLPVTIARLWAYSGGESTAVPAIVAGLFMTATAGAVVVLAGKWGRVGSKDPDPIFPGLLAGTALLAARTYVAQASCMCADVPLGYYILVSIGLAVLGATTANGAFLVIAGAAAGLAAWTKNEGLVLLMLVFPVAVAAARGRRVAAALQLASGAAVPVTALAVFKGTLAPPSYLIAQGADALVSKLGDPARWTLVASRFSELLPAWGEVPGSAFGATALAAALIARPDAAAVRRGCLGLLLAAAMMAAYATVYVITPADVLWQIATSFDRLVTQLWPAIVWAVFQLSGGNPRASGSADTG
jgi:hypothetical protein